MAKYNLEPLHWALNGHGRAMCGAIGNVRMQHAYFEEMAHALHSSADTCNACLCAYKRRLNELHTITSAIQSRETD